MKTPLQMLQSLSKALEDLYANWPFNFDEVVLKLASCSEHLIFSGVGKSGWIAKKVASTFSSIGCPSFFIDACEAGHGDLGALTDKNFLIVFSNSGSTLELLPLMRKAFALNCKSLLITSQEKGALAQYATDIFRLKEALEICPFNVAPTTSTLLMLALGDILAMQVMQQKKITLRQYHDLHPKGALGKQLLSVKDHMHQDVPIVFENQDIQSALVQMSEKGLGCLAVCDASGALIGVISDGDIRRGLLLKQNIESVQDLMQYHPKTISGDKTLKEALFLMNQYKISFVFVVDDFQKPIGVLHLHDCLKI